MDIDKLERVADSFFITCKLEGLTKVELEFLVNHIKISNDLANSILAKRDNHSSDCDKCILKTSLSKDRDIDRLIADMFKIAKDLGRDNG